MRSDQCQPLDIVLYRGTGFTSWLIQALTKSRYNHVAVVVGPELHLGIESNVGHQSGVRAFDLRRIDRSSVDVYRLKPEYSVDRDAVVSYLVGHLGSGYDYWGVIYLGILKILSLLSLGRFRPYNAFQIKKDYFCSELCWEAFATDGMDLTPQTGSSDVTSPGDIAESPMLYKAEIEFAKTASEGG